MFCQKSLSRKRSVIFTKHTPTLRITLTVLTVAIFWNYSLFVLQSAVTVMAFLFKFSIIFCALLFHSATYCVPVQNTAGLSENSIIPVEFLHSICCCDVSRSFSFAEKSLAVPIDLLVLVQINSKGFNPILVVTVYFNLTQYWGICFS